MREHTGAWYLARAAAGAAACLAIASFGSQARTIRVPTDVATIQGGIDVAVNGDRVLVAPGTYLESIDFNGKAITVVSDKGADVTIIDAGLQRSVARFHTGETRASVLKGFTLRNGNAADLPPFGGGVQVSGASPTIDSNTITMNSACSGHGVALFGGSALVRNNHIHNNRRNGCSGGILGGGIYILGDGAAEVTDNLIENNQADLDGGGIALNSASTPLIARNVIRGNVAGSTGGGISLSNYSRPIVVNNLVYDNTGGVGGGLAVFGPSGAGGTWVNNTIADNIAQFGTEIWTSGFVASMQLVNNIIRATGERSAVECDSHYTEIPTFTTNNLFTTVGTLLSGSCANVLASGGNISADPQFGRERPRTLYRLTAGSPAIDAGTPASMAGSTDAAGRPRIVDGNGDGTAVIDLGAYEFKPPR